MQIWARLNAKLRWTALLSGLLLGQPCWAESGEIKAAQFLDVDVQLVPAQSAAIAAEVTATIGVLPGGIFGYPLKEPRLPISNVGVQNTSFALYLTQPLYQTLAERIRVGGLTVLPEDTKVARVATGGYTQANPTRLLGGGFKTPVTGIDLVLVYVDRASSITGIQLVGAERMSIDVRFPASGFYWLQIDDGGNVGNAEVPSLVRYEVFYEE